MAKIKDPSKKENKKKLTLHPFEWVWYILCGLVALWGLTYIVLGSIAENLPIKANDDGLVKINLDFAKTFKLDFLGWGLIILAIASVAIVLVLLLFSNKVDRDYEKNVRRAQRMAQLDAEVEREEKAELGEYEVVDAEVAPVQEEKPAEEPVKEEAQAEEEKPEEPAK